jgi:ELWxxDGT repeat protein
LTNVNGTLFFQANDGVHGAELWRSNGTSFGTFLVKDIRAGSASSSPKYLTNVNGTLFFQANDGVRGKELWKSTGTAAGTVLVKDIRPGIGYSVPNDLTNVNGTLFFQATDGVHGLELWQSNGAFAGTVLVADIRPGSAGSYPGDLTNINDTLFFSANDGVHGFEPWVLGPVPVAASTAPALVVPPSSIPGPAAGLPLDLGAAGLSLAVLADQRSGTVRSADSAGRELLLLEGSQSLGTATTESARRSPALLGPKSQPHLPGDFGSEDPASDPPFKPA